MFKDPDFTIASIETQGWRISMEDFVMSETITNRLRKDRISRDALLGIFDGHGGSMVSLYCKAVLPKIIQHNFDRHAN